MPARALAYIYFKTNDLIYMLSFVHRLNVTDIVAYTCLYTQFLAAMDHEI